MAERSVRSRDDRRHWQERVPTVFAWVLTLLAVLCAVAAVSGVYYQRTQWVRLAVDTMLAPAPANLAYATFIAVLAAGVARRKRLAFWILAGFLGLQLAGDLLAFAAFWLVRVAPPQEWDADLANLSWYEPWLTAGNLALTVVALAVLGMSSRQFYARVQRASIPKALITLVGLAAVFSVLGWMIVETFPGTLVGAGDRFSYAAERVLGGAVVFDITRERSGRRLGQPDARPVRRDRPVRRPLRAVPLAAGHRRAGTPTRSGRSAACSPSYGERDSLGYFATRRDKAVDLLADRQGRRHLPGGHRRQPGQRRPDRRPEAWGPAIDAWLDAGPRLRAGPRP